MPSERSHVLGSLLVLALAMLGCKASAKSSPSAASSSPPVASAASSVSAPDPAGPSAARGLDEAQAAGKASASASASAAAPAHPMPPKNMAKCGAKEIAAANGGTRCLTRCTSDKDCQDGESCDLLGYWTAEGPRNGKACHNIMNGGSEVLSTFKGAPTDGTGATSPGRPKAPRIAVGTGDCPKGWQLDPDTGNMCERVCKTDSDCDAPDKCKAVGPIGLDKQCHK